MFNLFEAFTPRLLVDIPIIGPIWDAIQRALPLQSWIDSAYQVISNLAYWEKLLFGILALFIVILGVIAFVKKLSKLLIVVAILVGLWLLYNQGVFG